MKILNERAPQRFTANKKTVMAELDRQSAQAVGSVTRRKPRRRVYSRAQLEAINSQLPQALTDAMNRTGWNVFGIYEVCRTVLKKVPEKRLVSRKALVHGIANCMNCGWECQDYLTVQSAAQHHAKQTGHRVSVELGYHMEIAANQR